MPASSRLPSSVPARSRRSAQGKTGTATQATAARRLAQRRAAQARGKAGKAPEGERLNGTDLYMMLREYRGNVELSPGQRAEAIAWLRATRDRIVGTATPAAFAPPSDPLDDCRTGRGRRRAQVCVSAV